MLVCYSSCSIWTIALMLITWSACGVAECNCKKAGSPSSPKSMTRAARPAIEIPSADKLAEKLGIISPSLTSGHWRQEQKQEDGSVRGRYGYTDSNGFVKSVEYFADHSGFHVLHVKTRPPKHSQDVQHDTFSPFLGVLPPSVSNLHQHQDNSEYFPTNEI